jgi:murein DD-endopeptidase MepM/ murein hydrolase activator NlpD
VPPAATLTPTTSTAPTTSTTTSTTTFTTSTTAATTTSTTSVSAPSTTLVSTTVSPTTTSTTTTPTTTTAAPRTVPPVIPADFGVEAEPYTVPIPLDVVRGWGPGHGSGYRAVDVFADCGSPIVAPTNGTVVQVRRTDRWDADVDDPATRGGLTVALVGDDGVRYYLAHFDSIEGAISDGVRVEAGALLGRVGVTGRSGGCHVHLGISPPCPGTEWSVRRGVVWPQPYLDAWAAGSPTSPTAEIDAWWSAQPTACADAAADPSAPNA